MDNIEHNLDRANNLIGDLQDDIARVEAKCEWYIARSIANGQRVLVLEEEIAVKSATITRLQNALSRILDNESI